MRALAKEATKVLNQCVPYLTSLSSTLLYRGVPKLTIRVVSALAVYGLRASKHLAEAKC
jgi:hypothetical protein